MAETFESQTSQDEIKTDLESILAKTDYIMEPKCMDTITKYVVGLKGSSSLSTILLKF